MSTEAGARPCLPRPWVWIALAVCAAVALGCWGLSTPTGSSPDDDFHLASIWCATGPAQGAVTGDVCTEVNGNRGPGTVVRVLPLAVSRADCSTRFTSIHDCDAYKVHQVCFDYTGPRSPVCAGALKPGTGAHAANAGLYPGGFYLAMHPFTSGQVVASVLWMRAVNALVAMVVIGAAFLVSERRTRSAYALTVALGVCTPIGLLFIPSSNPTAWSIIGIGSVWAFLVVFLTTASVWRRRVALLGCLVAWGLPVAARADAPVLAALSVIGATAVAHRGPWASRRLVLPGLLVIASMVMFFVGSGTDVAESGISTVAAGDGSGPPPETLATMAHNAAHPIALFFHNLLVLWAYERDMFTEGTWTAILPAALVLLLLAALTLYRGRQRLGYGGLLLASVAIPMYVAQRSHLSVSVWYIQRRYLFPLMLSVIGLAFLAAVRRGWVERVAARRWAVTAVWAVLSVIASMALHLEILRYVVGWHLYQFGFDAGRHWWWTGFPLSPMAVWVIGSVAMAVMLALLLRIAVTSAYADAADRPEPTTIVPHESSAA